MRAHGARRTHDESLEADHVAVGVEQDAVGHLPVPARAPRLLVVALHRLGQTGVDHVAHVRLVDAHAKGYGGTDDLPTRYCLVIWLAPKYSAVLSTTLGCWTTSQKVMNPNVCNAATVHILGLDTSPILKLS